MTDLFDTETIDAFKSAMRDVTDTFFKYPVTLERESFDDLTLQAGLRVITRELKEREGGEEIDEAYGVRFNREYLREKGLVDGNDELLIGYDDGIRIKGKRYHIAAIQPAGIIRDDPLLAYLEVVR